MAGAGRHKRLRKQAVPAPTVTLEYEATEDAEDRLLRVYEFLLGLPEPPETSSKGGELT
jgi:hypothetical protein